MRYGGIYLYILYSFKKNVVMFSLPIRTKKTKCPPSISLIYIAANSSTITTYTPNLPLILYYYVFVSYI